MKIALIGYGKMGREVELGALAKGYTITGKIDQKEWQPEELNGAEVCVEFTRPDSVMENIARLAEAKKQVVVGTSGWYDRLDEVRRLVDRHEIGLVYAPNFSLGVNLFLKLVEQAGELINPFDHYDVGGYEIHHKEKKDSPSGTAMAVVNKLLDKIDRKTKVEYETLHQAPAPETVHYPSLRVGHVPGTHVVQVDGLEETITLKHEARTRAGFARGALLAAEWVKGKKGMYTFEQIIDEVLA